MSLPAGLDPATLAGVLAVFLLGGIVKGGLGFGLPLVTIALLPFLVAVDLALAINVLVQPVVNVGQLTGSGRAGEAIRRFWPMLPALALGTALGALFVRGVEPDTLMLLLGLFIMAFAVLDATGAGLPVPPRRERAAGLGTGLAAGVVGALTTANGPVFVMYLVSLRLDRRLFRATLGLLFIVSPVLIAGSFAGIGLLDAPRAALALLCIPPALLGMWAGARLAGRLDARGFRRAVLAGLFCLGANFALRGSGAV